MALVALALLITSGADVARAQDEAITLEVAPSQANEPSETELVLEQRYRAQVRRSRIHGGLLAAGFAVGAAGAVGSLLTYCLGCDERASVPLNMATWATIGIMGATTMIVGAMGLLSSGIRRHRISADRRRLRVDPGFQTADGQWGLSLTVHGVW